jgi:hypothetical protein
MSQLCATLSDFNFSSEDSSSSEEDEKIKCKKVDFTGLCLMAKSSWNDSDSDSDVSDDLSFESLSSKVIELENALCNQDKSLCKVFYENKKLNLEMQNSFTEIASLWSMHDDMNAKPCENLSGSLPRVPLATGYGPKSLIRWAFHSGTQLGPTHHVSGDSPTSKGCTYGPLT